MKNDCPVQEKGWQSGVVYQAAVTREDEWTCTLGFENPLLKIDSETTNPISKLEIQKTPQLCQNTFGNYKTKRLDMKSAGR